MGLTLAQRESAGRGSALRGPIYVEKSDGTFVAVADADGNVDAPVTTTDLTTTGNTTLGDAVTDTTAINGATTITTTSASGLTVGRQGATAPVLKVNAATASVATGIEITGAAAAGGVAVAAISSGTNENLTVNAKGSGTVTIAGTSTGNISLARATGIAGATTVTSAGANALAAGVNGATNPAFNVDASTASSATGFNVKSAAAAGGLALSVISSGTNENLTLDAKGSGTITVGGTSTGNVSIQRSTTVNGQLTANGITTLVAGEAVAAGGNTNSRVLLSTTANLGIYFGSGAPTVSAAKGSWYMRTDGSGVGDRMYVNTDGGTTWTAVTTAA